MTDISVNELLEKRITERNEPIPFSKVAFEDLLKGTSIERGDLNKRDSSGDDSSVGASLNWLGWNKDNVVANLSRVDSHAEEMEKIRKVMGNEWKGHICNACAKEAGSKLYCRCTWKCKRHTLGKLYEESVARGASS
jgi:hypothetical protein